jgi:RimJ/RimL family protein N-acetyltransferase
MLVQGAMVAQWVYEETHATLSPRAQAIGQLKDGELIAAVAYDEYTTNNILAHIRIDGKPTRDFWHAIFHYPFEELGCKRITGIVEESNDKAVKLNKHLGFVEEARLKEAAHDGKDMVIMVMWKKDCRMLNWRRT